LPRVPLPARMSPMMVFAVFERGFGLIVERGVVEEFADGAFLRADVGEDGVDVVHALIHFGVEFIVHQDFAESSLPRLNVTDNLIALSEDAVEVIVGLVVVEKFADGTFACVDVANDILNLFAEGFEVGENVGAPLDDFLDGFFLGAGNGLAFLERHAGVAALDVDVTIAEEAFGDQRGGGIGENVALISGVNANIDLDVVHAIGGLTGLARDEANLFDVADFDAVEANRSADGEAGDFRQKSFEAIFGAEEAGASDIKNGDGENQKANENEQPTRNSDQVICLRCAIRTALRGP